jgi:HD-GYP domain-containing protein (c-di-GMP phosphodiesterase class II)
LASEEARASSRILFKISGESRHLFLKLHRLQQISVLVSAEQNLDRLLAFILTSARELCNADAGSIFVRVDEIALRKQATGKDDLYLTTPYIVLKAAQNDSLEFPFREMKLPFDKSSIAGYVALSRATLNIPDVYRIPPGAGYSHSSKFDEATGYRSRSMLVIPMSDMSGEVVGVLQLINKKKSPAVRLAGAADVDRHVEPFDEVDEELIQALASQAAISIEKTNLYNQIRSMFRGFVKSLIGVLERRNYTTFGHCKRIADYALALARCINQHPDGAFPGVEFTPEQLEELEYGALLHDIGKLSVPDAVLDKRNKLTLDQLRIIEYRFGYVRQSLMAKKGGREDEETRKTFALLAKFWEVIKRCNIPSQKMPEEDLRALEEIRAFTFVDIDGIEKPLLSEFELENLSIRYGNLTASERKAIEKHVEETWEILKTIPWAKHLRRVPNIAGTHHEKTDGSGYPWKLKASEIPLGGKILGITDIFEALTAQDRPYKRPMLASEANQILSEMVGQGKLDRDLFELFVKHKLYSVHIDENGRIRMPSVRQSTIIRE